MGIFANFCIFEKKSLKNCNIIIFNLHVATEAEISEVRSTEGVPLPQRGVWGPPHADFFLDKDAKS